MTMNIHAGGGEAARRREEVLRIVRDGSIHSQEELLVALRKSGFRVTQPTLSRDMRELGLAKTPAGYVVPGEVTAPGANVATFAPRESKLGRLDALIRDSVIFAEAAGNLVVIKTPAAAAQPVASAIDSADIEDLLGTVGGDDTIFVAFRTPAAADSFARRVHQTAGFPPARRRRA